MGIYLLNMKMPTGNDELRLIIHSNGQVIISHETYFDETEAIPVPSHGRPVVRGKWLQDCDYHFRCSVCGDRWTVSNGNPLDISNGWNYCPNCGADMREVDDAL